MLIVKEEKGDTVYDKSWAQQIATCNVYSLVQNFSKAVKDWSIFGSDYQRWRELDFVP